MIRITFFIVGAIRTRYISSTQRKRLSNLSSTMIKFDDIWILIKTTLLLNDNWDYKLSSAIIDILYGSNELNSEQFEFCVKLLIDYCCMQSSENEFLLKILTKDYIKINTSDLCKGKFIFMNGHYDLIEYNKEEGTDVVAIFDCFNKTELLRSIKNKYLIKNDSNLSSFTINLMR